MFPLSLPGLADVGTPQLWEPIGPRQTASSSSSIDWSWTKDYEALVFHCSGVLAGTNQVGFIVRTSNDAGATYDSGASDYGFRTILSTTSAAFTGSTGSTGMNAIGAGAGGLGNVAGETLDITVLMLNPFDTSLFTQVYWSGYYESDAAGNPTVVQGGGRRNAAERCDGLQFTPTTGNFASGVFSAFGLLRA